MLMTLLPVRQEQEFSHAKVGVFADFIGKYIYS
jgi:hypothetical protein